MSIQVFNEYEEILKRPQSLSDLKLNNKDIEHVLRFIAYIGKPYATYFLFRPNLKDENDNIFIELAVASNCDYVITNNVKDFTTKTELRSEEVSVITPANFVKMWRKKYET
jgi:predicted nucleic acid-binding protein